MVKYKCLICGEVFDSDEKEGKLHMQTKHEMGFFEAMWLGKVEKVEE
ncbi:MAG: hypothetical protein H3Z50_02895 [archaeon]|nr:hypothetical protein [archaeon]MCP8306829.1 hypothetical protein [archaeon]